MSDVAIPIYLVIDSSGSMTDVREDVHSLIDVTMAQISTDSALSDLFHLAVITFATDATVLVPLTPGTLLARTDVDRLSISFGGRTNYGPALALLLEKSRSDIQQLKKQGVRVYRPLVFFITDGAPQDDQLIAGQLAELRDSPLRVVALSIGPMDPTTLLGVSVRGLAALARSSTSPRGALAACRRMIIDYIKGAQASTTSKQSLGLRLPPEFLEVTREMV